MYYIAIIPPEGLAAEIREFKEEIRRDFASKHALRSPAHITLQMPFHYEEGEEQHLLSSLHGFAATLEGFECRLKNFGNFDNRVIFVDVESHPLLSSTREQLQEVLRTQFGFSEKKLPRRFHPHITIANRDLRPELFPACRDAFTGRSFEKTFPVQSFWLLKHRGDHWEPYREFPFSQP